MEYILTEEQVIKIKDLIRPKQEEEPTENDVAEFLDQLIDMTV